MTSKNLTAPVHVNSIFQRDWWLDAVAPNQWKTINVKKNDLVLARMPIVETRRFGMRFVQMPRLTYTLGPSFIESGQKSTKRISKEKDLLNQIIDQLHPFDYFRQNFHPSIENLLPFQWRGFECSVMYTYILDDIEDSDTIWKNYQGSTRTEIRKAQKNLSVRDDLGLETIWRLSMNSYQHRGRVPNYDFELLKRVDQACEAHNARKMLFAVDKDGQVHSAVYIVWDENSAYYLIAGADAQYRKSGALTLLVHEAIRHAAQVTAKFDFMGCNLESFEFFKRNFGGRLTAHTKVSGFSRRFQILNQLRTLNQHAR